MIATAQAQITPDPVNFGIVHVGDVDEQDLTISNVASAGASGLDASIQSETGDATASGGPIDDLAAGLSSTAIEVGLNTSNAGDQTGTVTLAENSNLGETVDGVPITAFATTQQVQVEGTVNNYAKAEVTEASGDGSLSLQNDNGVNAYVLNLGTTTVGAADLTAELGLLNAAIGPADVLSATFEGPAGSSQYTNSGFGSVSGVDAGSVDDIGSVDLSTSEAGTYTETLVVKPTGSNASGYSGALPTETVEIIGTVTQPVPVYIPPVSGEAWGDVHMVTFDGLTYNMQGVGEFILAESTQANNSYLVEIRTAPWSNSATVSVITQVAAQVGSDRVTFGLGRQDVVWINGVGQTLAIGQAQSIDNGAGSIVQTASSTYQLTWATGETLDVTSNGSYFTVDTSLAQGEGAGSVEGLLGSDNGQANDFEVGPNTAGTGVTAGTILTGTLSQTQLYGEFVQSWRIPAGTQGLFDYGAGETTDSFTDLNFPGDTISLSQLEASDPGLVQAAQAAVQAAGITDPGLQLDAELDLIVTGDAGAIDATENQQQSGVTTTQAQVTGSLTTPTLAGVSAGEASQVEAASGTTAVSFTAYLTTATTTDTQIAWSVYAPNTGDLGYSSANLAAFGGALPTGDVTIAAGQTTANFTVDLPNSVLGALPSGVLEVLIAGPSNVAVFAPVAQTTIVNNQPEPGAPAQPSVFEVSGGGQLQKTGNVYVLNLGNVVQGQSITLQLGVANNAGGLADNLGGAIADAGSNGFVVTGDGTLSAALTPGQNYEGLYVVANTQATGAQSDTLTFDPVDENQTGYSADLAPLTIEIEDNVVAAASAAINPGAPQPVSVNLGVIRAGLQPSGAASQTLDIENDAATGGADLDASVASASAGVTGSGIIADLAPGQSSSDISVGLDTSSGGAKYGEVDLAFTSDAGNGNTETLAQQQVTVSGTVYEEANVEAAPVNSIIHVGDTTVQDFVVTNINSNDGYSEGALVTEAGVTGSSALSGVAGSSGLILAGANSDALQYRLASTATAGSYSGTVSVDLVTDGNAVATGQGGVISDGFGETDLGDVTSNFTVQVNNYAVAQFEKTAGAGALAQTSADAYTLNLGTVLQDTGVVTTGFGVLNAAPSAYSDLLTGNFTISGNTDGAFLQGALAEFTNLDGGQSYNSPQVALSTAQAGDFSETITLNPTNSNSTGYSEALATQTLTIEADVVPVTVNTPTETVDEGSGGGSVSVPLDIADTATTGDPITATITGFSGDVTGTTGGSITLQPGQEDDTTLAALFSTAKAGNLTGDVDFDLTQDGKDLGSVSVPVGVTVEAPAVPELVLAGGVGTLTQTGADSYTLNLGKTSQGAGALIADLAVTNAATGAAQALGGSFEITGQGAGYANGGFGSFSGYTAGQTTGIQRDRTDQLFRRR